VRAVRAWVKGLSAFDWFLLGGVAVVVMVFAAIVATLHQPNDTRSDDVYVERANDRPRDSAYKRAAERHGYSGREADYVGAAAERICSNTGNC
jgi:hypothetical protein